MEELDLGLQATCVTGGSFADPDDAFVRIEFKEEELTSTTVGCDVIYEVMACFGNLHGVYRNVVFCYLAAPRQSSKPILDIVRDGLLHSKHRKAISYRDDFLTDEMKPNNARKFVFIKVTKNSVSCH